MTLFDQAVKNIRAMAIRNPSATHFWADCLNYASGNVKGLLLIFDHAQVSTTDIQKAYEELRKENNP